MYGIALSVAACLRAGTRVDVAWNLDPGLTPRLDPNDAVAITPGGGRLGGLLDGVIDSRLIEEAGVGATTGRVISVALQPHEAAQLSVDPGTTIRVLISPADALPVGLWEALLERERVALDLEVAESLVTAAALADAGGTETRVVVDESSAATTWSPRTTLVVFGRGPMAAAVADAGRFVGWNVEATVGVEPAVALATSLSTIDGIVVMGHDTEEVGRVLQTALGSGAGYIGSLGPTSLQEARGDWLAYRGLTDLSRISGPAGLDIGASSPPQVAVSIVAEMIATLTS
ncbi:MAG: XdhC family protein [Actinomycetota bacterium]